MMNFDDFQRGVQDARANIEAGSPKLYFRAPGKWGELFTKLVRDRFDVEVVNISDRTSEFSDSFITGYHSVTKGYIEGKFGSTAFAEMWGEIVAFREECLRRRQKLQDERGSPS